MYPQQTNSSNQFIYTATDNLEGMLEANNYNHFLVKTLAKHLHGKRRILDFGAGIGYFARHLRALGYSITCIEPDPIHTHLLELQGFDCKFSLENTDVDSHDGAYVLNVLEHIDDDGGIIKQLHSTLTMGGVLVIYVPAFPILFSSMDRKVGHLRRYRAPQLKVMVQKHGFRISYCAYVDFLGAFATLLFRIIGNRRGDLNAWGLKLFDRFAFPLSRCFDKLTSRFFGKNLLITAIKR